MTSTTQTTTQLCPGCKRPVTIPAQFKAVVCAYCGAKVVSTEKVGTK